MFACLSALTFTTLATTPLVAGPLSIGVSNQVQVGWVRSSLNSTRVTRLLEEGTAGQNITPANTTGTFTIYGTSFVPNNLSEPFEYRSILRETSTVTNVQVNSLTNYGTQANTNNTVNTSAMGFFDQGNSAF